MRLSLSQKVKTNCKIDSLTYAQNPVCFIMLKMRSSMSSWLKFQDYMDVRTCIDLIAGVPLGIHRWLHWCSLFLWVWMGHHHGTPVSYTGQHCQVWMWMCAPCSLNLSTVHHIMASRSTWSYIDKQISAIPEVYLWGYASIKENSYHVLDVS